MILFKPHTQRSGVSGGQRAAYSASLRARLSSLLVFHMNYSKEVRRVSICSRRPAK